MRIDAGEFKAARGAGVDDLGTRRVAGRHHGGS